MKYDQTLQILKAIEAIKVSERYLGTFGEVVKTENALYDAPEIQLCVYVAAFYFYSERIIKIKCGI